MHQILLSKELATKVSDVQLSCIECDVETVAIHHDLWDEIRQKIIDISSSIKIEDISGIPAIAASRKAYKVCGKDPSRYRLSAEALLRRIVNRGEIYQINNVVDLLNFVSITTGFSIGGYDAEKIKGTIVFGIGKPNEPYIGIGRGELNIENMPVFKDEDGAFGTSTSDSERTSVSLDTKRFLMIIIDYSPVGKLNEAADMALKLLHKYAGAKNVEYKIISK